MVFEMPERRRLQAPTNPRNSNNNDHPILVSWVGQGMMAWYVCLNGLPRSCVQDVTLGSESFLTLLREPSRGAHAPARHGKRPLREQLPLMTE